MSVPIHYYTLASPVAPTTPSVERKAAAIDVRTVLIPAQLNRSELVIRHGVGELIILDNERWSSPLNEEIKIAIRNELGARWNQNTDSAASKTMAHWQISIEIEAFDAQLDHSVLVEAIWSASDGAPGGPAITNCRFRSYEKIDHGYPAIVVGFQQATRSLADAIVATIHGNEKARLTECEVSNGTT